MALPADTVWEVRTTGTAANVNGGGFSDANKGATGVDYSQQAAAQASWTAGGGSNDLACVTATSVLTSVSGGFTNAMLGNLIHITAGTNFTVGWYCITAFTSSSSVTLDRSPVGGTSGTGGTGYVGGCLRSLNKVGSDPIPVIAAGNTIHVKSGTYTAAAPISGYVSGTNALPIKIIGYNATRGDNPSTSNMPLFEQGASQSFSIPADCIVSYISWSATAGNIVLTNNLVGLQFCKLSSTGSLMINSGSNSGNKLYCCELSSPSGTAVEIFGWDFYYCYFHDCKQVFSTAAGNRSWFFGCVFDTCNVIGPGLSSDLWVANTFVNCRVGIDINDQANQVVLNNNFVSCTTAITSASSMQFMLQDNNNFFNNGTDVNNVTKGPNDLAVDPAFPTTIKTGTDGTTNGAPGTTFTSAGSNFSTVTTNDYIAIKAGAGATLGIYAISVVAPGGDNTKLTLATSPGNSLSSLTFGIVCGSLSTDLSVGTNLKALGAPMISLLGSATRSYVDIGAAQRQEAAAGGLLVGNSRLNSTLSRR